MDSVLKILDKLAHAGKGSSEIKQNTNLAEITAAMITSQHFR